MRADQLVTSRVGPTPVQPHWDALRSDSLVLPRCEHCGTWHPVTSRFCIRCRATDLCWRATAGRGRLASYSTVHQAPYPALTDDVPYTVAVVELVEGPAMVARLGHLEELAIADIGRPVELLPCPLESGLATFGFSAPADG